MNESKILIGDSLDVLKTLPDGIANTCITSPPYYGLRDYGVDGQIGLEPTPDEFISRLVAVFSEVKRVLRDDGTLWINIGDSYWGSGKGFGDTKTNNKFNTAARLDTKPAYPIDLGLKPKDLIGIPWMLAFALRADGWYLRQDIIWSKKNCMPESVTDRCTKSHEYLFMLSKSPKYYYDQDAIKELAVYDVDGTGTAARKARAKQESKSYPDGKRSGIRSSGFKDASKMNGKHADKQAGHGRRFDGFNNRWNETGGTGYRNKRSVWTISPAQFPEAHFATFPEELPMHCIKAGCPLYGIVLDPFFGAGTTGLVSEKLNRKFIGIELNPEYVNIARNRITGAMGIFAKAI